MALIKKKLTSFREVEEFTLDATDIANKSVTLTKTPTLSSKVVVDVPCGVVQVNGVDFVVTSNVVSWDSLGMEVFLEIGDKILVVYS